MTIRLAVQSAQHGMETVSRSWRRVLVFRRSPLVAYQASRTCRTRRVVHDPRALSEPHSPAMPNATTPAPQTSGSERETLLVGLRRMGLANDDRFVATPLAGGVSSDIFLVETSGRSFVVKRALAKLRVAADWRAPVERNRYEVEWMKEAGRAAPNAVPRILGHDEASGLFAMEYLPPDDYPIWKSELREGRADPSFAMEVGRLLAMIHAATADSEDVASRFATDRIFKPIRLEPYLEATAAKYASSNPAAHDALMSLSRETLGRKIALVHGDISPKNILCGPHGPVFLDAECAWYGDPAFDLAFCLNHLLLKCLWTPAAGVSILLTLSTRSRTAICGASRTRIPTRWRRVQRPCCQVFSWRASTASRRSNTSCARTSAISCGASRCR